MSDGEKISAAFAKFDEFQTVFLATSANDLPAVRPVTLVSYKDRRWIATGTCDAKMDQIRDNPSVEICFTFKEGNHTGYVRSQGEARIIGDPALRAELAAHMPYFGEYWKSPDDTKYTLLEIVLAAVEYLEPGKSLAERSAID